MPTIILKSGLFLLLLFYPLLSALAFTKEDPEQLSWHISASVIEYKDKSREYVASKNVIITGGTTRLEADYVQYSDLTKDAFARGNVTLISGQDVLSCESMHINLATEQGLVQNGFLFLEKNHLYVEAENLKKTGAFTYSATKGSITSCKGKNPDWKITGKNIRVTVEGYGLVNHAAFRIKGIPVLYTPFLVFPVKNQRQTGLLPPIISHSERKGFSYDQPFFVALSRNTDLTFFSDYMSTRGVKTGASFRYVLDPDSRGSMFLDFLKDDKTDDALASTSDYGFAATPRRLNNDRYWFRIKADQNLPLGIRAMLDLDIASDPDYLREFREGHSGYDKGRSYFLDEFGRGLDAYSQTVRKNTLTMYRAFEQYSFSGQAVWYDDLVARRHYDQDTTLQILPAVRFDIIRTPLQDTGFYYSFNSEFSSFYRKDTTKSQIRGQRVDVFPVIYYPMKFRNLFFEPYAGVRTTAWHAQDFVSASGNNDSKMTRVLPHTGASLSTTISRIFLINKPYADKLKHEITPKIFYEYIPEKGQDDLPCFDLLDRLQKKNSIGWSLTQTFTKKTIYRKNDSETFGYHDIAWIKLSQKYNFSSNTDPIEYDSQREYGTFITQALPETKNETFLKRDQDSNINRPWSDILMEAEIHPSDFLSFDTDFSLCTYTGHFRKLNFSATLKDRRGDSFICEYRYAANDPICLESLYNRLHIRLNNNIELYGILEQDLYSKKTVETKAGISLDRSCWHINIEFAESSGDKRLGFLVNLSGLGSWGN